MIILDTNLASEAMKTRPDPAVRAWLNEQSAEMLCLSSVSLAELLFGIAALPSGKRKDSLSAALDGLIAVCRGGILSFDAVAARRYAELAVIARAAGRGFPLPDGYIAAIAAVHGCQVGTRDMAPFEAAGIAVINPWDWDQ